VEAKDKTKNAVVLGLLAAVGYKVEVKHKRRVVPYVQYGHNLVAISNDVNGQPTKKKQFFLKAKYAEKGGITEVTVTDKVTGQFVGNAHAICCKRDNYDYKEGLALCLERVMPAVEEYTATRAAMFGGRHQQLREAHIAE
jgi:hypothetical protein